MGNLKERNTDKKHANAMLNPVRFPNIDNVTKVSCGSQYMAIISNSNVYTLKLLDKAIKARDAKFVVWDGLYGAIDVACV